MAFAVKPVGAGVDDGIADAGRAIASRGVPGGDDRVGCRGAARLARAVEHLAAQHRAGDARAVDLAVVEMGGEGAAFRRAILGCGPQKVGVSRRRSHPKLPAHMAGTLERHDLGEVVVVAVLDRLLIERGLAACGVVGGRHQIPLARDERDVGRERIRVAGAVAHAERQRAILADFERITAVVGVLPTREQPLAALSGRAGPDIGPEREGAAHRKPAFRVRNPDEAPQLRVLLGHGMRPVHRGIDLALDEAGALGILVAVDQAHELKLRPVRALRAHHDVEPLARPGAEAVAIARQSDLRHRSPLSPGLQEALFISASTRLRKTAWSASFLSAVDRPVHILGQAAAASGHDLVLAAGLKLEQHVFARER